VGIALVVSFGVLLIVCAQTPHFRVLRNTVTFASKNVISFADSTRTDARICVPSYHLCEMYIYVISCVIFSVVAWVSLSLNSHVLSHIVTLVGTNVVSLVDSSCLQSSGCDCS
jgi:hypothetical protein